MPRALEATRWRSAKDALSAIRDCRLARSDGGWIMALGADFDSWQGGLPGPDELDEAAGGMPAVIIDFSLHRCLASSAARAKCDIAVSGRHRADDVDTIKGRASGLLWETPAAEVITAALRAFSKELGVLGHETLLKDEATRHLALGIVACHDPCVPASMNVLLERLRKVTPLRLSWSAVAEEGFLEPAADSNICETCGTGPASAKLFVDGAHKCALCLNPGVVLKMMGGVAKAALSGRFAPLRDMFSYRSTYRSGQIYTPYLRIEPDELFARLEALSNKGVQTRIHAVGNHAASCACKALRDAGVRDATLEHLTFLSDADIEAVAATGAGASLQPGFMHKFGPSILDRRLCPDLRAFPAASLLRAGVALALSSDNPCGPLDPLANIQDAVARRLEDRRIVDGREAVSLQQAIAAYTTGGHRAIHGQSAAGLNPGAPADFVILNGAPNLASSRVIETYIDGQKAWPIP